MVKIARIGIDTSKGSFQLHGVTRRRGRAAPDGAAPQFLEFMAKLEPR